MVSKKVTFKLRYLKSDRVREYSINSYQQWPKASAGAQRRDSALGFLGKRKQSCVQGAGQPRSFLQASLIGLLNDPVHVVSHWVWKAALLKE